MGILCKSGSSLIKALTDAFFLKTSEVNMKGRVFDNVSQELNYEIYTSNQEVEYFMALREDLIA